MKTSGSGQLRWVILLLVVAVVLPTVCLLWFMTAAVKNERLAVRQKLVDVYKEKMQPLAEGLERNRVKFEKEVEQAGQVDIFTYFSKICLSEKEYAEAMLIYDGNDKMLFPFPPGRARFADTRKFEKAWRLEFIDANYLDAAKEYQRAIMVSSIPDVTFQGDTAMVRCLEKGGKIKEAIELCKELAYPGKHIVNEYVPSDIIRARLKLIQLYQQTDANAFKKEAIQLLSDLTAAEQKRPAASEVRVFVLGELFKLIEQSQLPIQQSELDKARKILDAETLSLQAAEIIPNQIPLNQWHEKSLTPLDLAEKSYGILFTTENRKVIIVVRKSSVVYILKYIAQRVSDSQIAVSVFDDEGQPVYGENKMASEAFLTIKPSPYFGEWKLCFFFRNSDVFNQAAKRQENVYLWTAILVVVLILVSGGIAVQAVGRQIRLNKLKNDFIATVTHELKTPLASMRVLVDTLLEGRCESQQQETEYLTLVAKENQRLSHLIDNFLTFSRMERNKQAFEFAPADPKNIAECAAEAVQAKFSQKNCKFSVTIEDGLASIYADKDAIVTVLVNLLDNACKYSGDDKEIELNIFSEDSYVCFTVKDNGIGMTRRQIKRVFDRFYQADSSLARRAEGCGLGLAIVKFIVDAHKGRIDVDSKIGQGSVFTIKIPKI